MLMRDTAASMKMTDKVKIRWWQAILLAESTTRQHQLTKLTDCLAHFTLVIESILEELRTYARWEANWCDLVVRTASWRALACATRSILNSRWETQPLDSTSHQQSSTMPQTLKTIDHHSRTTITMTKMREKIPQLTLVCLIHLRSKTDLDRLADTLHLKNHQTRLDPWHRMRTRDHLKATLSKIASLINQPMTDLATTTPTKTPRRVALKDTHQLKSKLTSVQLKTWCLKESIIIKPLSTKTHSRTGLEAGVPTEILSTRPRTTTSHPHWSLTI